LQLREVSPAQRLEHKLDTKKQVTETHAHTHTHNVYIYLFIWGYIHIYGCVGIAYIYMYIYTRKLKLYHSWRVKGLFETFVCATFGVGVAASPVLGSGCCSAVVASTYRQIDLMIAPNFYGETLEIDSNEFMDGMCLSDHILSFSWDPRRLIARLIRRTGWCRNGPGFRLNLPRLQVHMYRISIWLTSNVFHI
jgi:hypothetical protein